MSKYTAIELRAYLKRAEPSTIEEFDNFRKLIDDIIKLRLEAERLHKNEPNRAKSRSGALPLDWLRIKEILFPPQDTPPEELVTQISRECLAEVEEICRDLRKVLIRERAKVPIGNVQQVDSHCLRWLTTQPGRNAVEKAGIKQRILAIIRNDNYNTLENRVFKDFLLRVEHEASIYIKKYSNRFSGHKTIKDVDKLRRICSHGLREPIMESVGAMRELPVPNYVLRQERRYSKIWKAYCELIRQADIAVRLWEQRDRLTETFEKMRYETEFQNDPRAKYEHHLWINPLDGKQQLLDKPFYYNELSSVPANISPVPKYDEVIIDLTGKPFRDLLVYSKHENAKPFLQNYDRPSIEENLAGNGYLFLHEILENRDSEKLCDYFEQLYAKVGGNKWIVLVPDDWDALRQEAVIKAVPLARNNVFLLWRSIAAILGAYKSFEKPKNGDTVVVIDVQQCGFVGLSKLMLTWDNDNTTLIPQRKSYIRHRECYDNVKLEHTGQHLTKKDIFIDGEKFKYCVNSTILFKLERFIGNARHIVFINNINELKDNWGRNPLQNKHWIQGSSDLIIRGVGQFVNRCERGLIPYFDELEELSLIVQTPDEKIIPKLLVKANEKSPGGKEQTIDTIHNAATLKSGMDKVSFFLCMGEASQNASLKLKKHNFGFNLEEDYGINLSARVKPGQGMAVVTVTSDFLSHPIELDFLHDMEDTKETIFWLEENMDRSFPPDSPKVLADSVLWFQNEYEVKEYLMGERQPDGSWFAKAEKVYPNRLSAEASPLEKLRRRNVFGNDQDHSLPKVRFDFDKLFKKLAIDYNNPDINQDVIRLIAWSYQGRLDIFRKIVKMTAQNILNYVQGVSFTKPQKTEYTLCANLSSDEETWSICLKAILLRIKEVKDTQTNISDYFRMLYNLLQFHPTIIKDTGIHECDRCWQWVQYFPYWYNLKRDSPIIGNILKSLLYFLRCRSFDGKIFLTPDRDGKHYKFISEMLDKPVHHTQEELRKWVINYLNGKGTIDGLPVD